jgi:glycerophosphoryl diester phosphodiesterase
MPKYIVRWSMYNQLPSPAIFAHRGSSAHAPENTLAAFQLALRQGADGIEMDTKLTADGHVVIFHDQTVQRTTEGTGRVKDKTLEELRELDAGSHFDVAFKGEPIPTLEEVFELVGTQIFINIELANYSSPFDRLPEKVAALVKRHGMGPRILFSSFNPVALKRIHRLIPGAPIGLLALKGRRGALARGFLGKLLVPYQSLHPALPDITPELVQNTHKENRRVYVFNVQKAAEMRQLFSMEVDGIFADDPLLARRVLKTSTHIA